MEEIRQEIISGANHGMGEESRCWSKMKDALRVPAQSMRKRRYGALVRVL